VQESVELLYVFQLCVAVEQQRGVVCSAKAAGMQLLKVARQAVNALSIKEPA
jgi:hypothetical protein